MDFTTLIDDNRAAKAQADFYALVAAERAAETALEAASAAAQAAHNAAQQAADAGAGLDKLLTLLYRLERLSPTGHLFEDCGGGSGPDERFGIGIVVFEVFLDGGFELRDALERAAADAVLGDQAEEALDLVEPGCRSRREVHMEPLVPLEPDPDAGMLVCGVVVGDQVHIKVLRRLGFDAAQEPEPFLMAMSLHTLADHPAGGDIECCEQRRCPMAFVVVRHGAASAFLDRQAGLRSVQRLDLAFFVDREHQCLVRRVEIEADNILYFLDEALVIRQLESLHQMRLEFVGLPDALHAGVAEVSRARHLADAPVGACHRLLMQGLMHDPLDRRRAQWRLAPRSRRISAQPDEAFRRKRSCQRQTVNLLLPTDRAMAITPNGQPTATRSGSAKPASAAYSVPKSNLPPSPDPQETARCMPKSSSCHQSSHAAASLGIFR